MESFHTKQKLIRHIHIHTNFKPCKCDICGASFAVESVLQQHYRVHSGENLSNVPFVIKHLLPVLHYQSILEYIWERPLVCKWPGVINDLVKVRI